MRVPLPALAALWLAATVPVPPAAWAQTAPPAPAAPRAPGAPARAAVPDAAPYVHVAGRESTHEDGVVKMTVFLDFFCSHCHHFDTVLAPLLKKDYGDRVRIEYVGFPVVVPKASYMPVLAYYLADAQGRGDAMRELLFAAIWDHKLDVTRPAVLLGVAEQAGLDLEAFKRGFNAYQGEYRDIVVAWFMEERDEAKIPAMRSKVATDMGERLARGIETAVAVGARGTPTFLVDNHLRLPGDASNTYSLRDIESVFPVVLGTGR